VAILADSRAHWATVQDDVHSVSRANDLISAALIGKKQAARWSRQLRSQKNTRRCANLTILKLSKHN